MENENMLKNLKNPKDSQFSQIIAHFIEASVFAPTQYPSKSQKNTKKIKLRFNDNNKLLFTVEEG